MPSSAEIAAQAKQLAWLVDEALGKVAKPDVQARILHDALADARLGGIPGDAGAFTRFAMGALHRAAKEILGDDSADAIVDDLRPMMAQIEPPPPRLPLASDPVVVAAPQDGRNRKISMPVGAVSSEPMRRRMTRTGAPIVSSRARHVTPEVVAPRADSMRRRMTRTGVPEVEGQRAGARILVVQADNEETGGVVAQLAAAGFHVDSVCGGRSALRACHAGVPDIVVTDLYMPDLGGKELIAALFGEYGVHMPPVIVLTSDAFAPKVLQGAVRVLRRPLRTALLREAVDEALRLAAL